MVDQEQGESTMADNSMKRSKVNFQLFDGDLEDQEAEMSDRKRRMKTVEFLSPSDISKQVEGQDPVAVFGSDIMTAIMSRLDARSVALSIPVSRDWYAISASDRLWTVKLEELLLGKAHLPLSAEKCTLPKFLTYSLCVMDGKRTRITKEDLCDHDWELHFQAEAPEYWRNLDPYWKGWGTPMRRYFHLDGSVSAGPRDPVWGGHESCYSIVTSYVGEGAIREHYVRINKWPRMRVTRLPDWSWVISNNICCYRSLPDADKGATGPPSFPF